MRRPESVRALEKLGRVRLSPSFFMRDFLHSEIADFYGIPNIPDAPDLAIEVGGYLCRDLLEPLQATFGRVAIRSAYRAPAVNARGNAEGLSCAANESNHAGHIWDRLDADGCMGATACRALAYWIHNHLPYAALQFFPRLAAFNIRWHPRPARTIYSYIKPKGFLVRGGPPDDAFASFYREFPALKQVV